MSAASARDIVTVSVAVCPLCIVSGAIVDPRIRSGVTVTVDDLVVPFAAAVIVTVRGAGASVVRIENATLDPLTLTELGTGAAASLELNATVAPDADAEKITLPFTVVPETTSLLLNAMLTGIGGVTEND